MKTNMQNERVFLTKELQQDNVFVKSKLVELSSLTGMPSRKGLERALVSENQIVNVVSDSYGHLPNEKSCRTAGYFGFFRELCSNGLHVAHSNIGFSVKHKGDIVEVVVPEIRLMVEKFMDNEYYSLHRKFEVLAERPIKDLKDFVKVTAEKFKLFQYECSAKNPEPSLNARMVLDIIHRESRLLQAQPTLWVGYNAFNAVLHGKLKKTFEAQKQLDSKIFEHLLTV